MACSLFAEGVEALVKEVECKQCKTRAYTMMCLPSNLSYFEWKYTEQEGAGQPERVRVKLRMK